MKNIGTYVTIAIFLIGIIAGFGKLQANTANNEKRLDETTKKVEELKTKVDKSEVTQEYTKNQVDNINQKMDKITDILIQMKETR